MTKAKARVEKEKVLVKTKIGVENEMADTKGKTKYENEKVGSKLINAVSKAPFSHAQNWILMPTLHKQRMMIKPSRILTKRKHN